jgi:hypothetical protein
LAYFLSQWLTAAGVAFFRLYKRLPGNSGAIKGLASGVLGCLAMDLAGAGPVRDETRARLWPALFSLAMMLTYNIVMGTVFGMIEPRDEALRPGTIDANERGQFI